MQSLALFINIVSKMLIGTDLKIHMQSADIHSNTSCVQKYGLNADCKNPTAT